MLEPIPTIRRSSPHRTVVAVDSLDGAHHFDVADSLVDRSTLGYDHHGSRSRSIGADGHSHRHNGLLADGLTSRWY